MEEIFPSDQNGSSWRSSGGGGDVLIWGGVRLRRWEELTLAAHGRLNDAWHSPWAHVIGLK